MRRVFLLVLVLALPILTVIACSKNESKGIPDTELGLSKSSVFDAPAPDKTRANQSDPGDRPLFPRGFSDQPPVIPHGVVEFLPITLADNLCIECHNTEEKLPGEPTPIPPSHYVDLRIALRVSGDEIVGARYNCVSCHISPCDNEPLVDNLFGK
jgi:nitrate reductase cytochrome c-type subunit